MRFHAKTPGRLVKRPPSILRGASSALHCRSNSSSIRAPPSPCSGADQNKSGDALQPINLDAQLQANFAFDSLYTAKGMRSLTMNRVPGRGDGTNCESEALPLSIRSLLE